MKSSNTLDVYAIKKFLESGDIESQSTKRVENLEEFLNYVFVSIQRQAAMVQQLHQAKYYLTYNQFIQTGKHKQA